MKKQQKHIESRDPDKVVREKYSASFMNNTKWNKLIDSLTDCFGQIYLNYKLIYSDAVKGYLFDMADFEPFFLEPIIYKEIEWVEIPNTYEDWINDNNRKAGQKLYNQNLIKIKTEIEKIGQFEIETNASKIIIYGYKK